MFKTILASMICFLFVNVHAYAADIDKIGVVDFQKIMDSSLEGKAVKNEIMKKGAELKSELDKAENEIKTLQEEYKKEALILNEQEKQAREREFRVKLNDFRKLQINNRKEFDELRVKLINEVKKDVVATAEKKGKAEGYVLIIEKQSGEVLYSPDSINITDDIIRDYDKSKRDKK